MEHRTFYYARVSSQEQNLARQLDAFRRLGASDRDIITDKQSGKDLDRAGYQALKNAMLRRGDTLVVKSLDRLSRRDHGGGGYAADRVEARGVLSVRQ